MSADTKPKENARSCLLHSASKLFARLGIDKTSTRDIAEESKVNISMISYHFGGKEGLYKQVITEFAESIQKNSTEILGAFEGQPLTRELFLQEMTLIIDHMIKTRLDNPEISILLAREKIEGLPVSREIHEKIFYPLVQKFLKLFQKAQKNKIVRDDVNAAVFFVMMTEGVWGFFEMMACRTKVSDHVEGLDQNPVQLRNQMLKIYLEGILL